jgi:hypothetical protein
MNYTADNIEKLRQDGKLQTYIGKERGEIALLSLSDIVEHHGNPYGSIRVHVGSLNGQCWLEPYQGPGGSVCMRIEGGNIESLSLAGYESREKALEDAKQRLTAAMQKARLEALAQAQARLASLTAAAA